MLVLRSPKGWTGPKSSMACGSRARSARIRCRSWSITRIPIMWRCLKVWMKSYKPEELFDGNGRLIAELAELVLKGEQRMGANPHANGGILLRDLRMPDFRVARGDVPSPGAVTAQDTTVLGNSCATCCS